MTVKMSGRLRLTTDTRAFTTNVMQGFIAQLNSKIAGRIPSLLSHIKDGVREALLNAPEFDAIRPNGKYYHEFGLPDANERIAAIVDKLVDSIQVRLTPFRYAGRTVAGNIRVYGLPTKFSEVMGMSEAVIIDKGEAFQWANALLLQGDDIVIQNHLFLSQVISDESNANYSRTGEGFMVERQGKSWRVPPDISGTESSNLVTRCLESPSITQLIETELVNLIG